MADYGKALSGNSYNNGGDYILGYDTKSYDTVPASGNTTAGKFQGNVAGEDSEKIMKHNIDTGRSIVPHDIHYAQNIRVTSLPSGWTTAFAVDVGDGLYNTSTTISDDEKSQGGEYAFYKPLAIASGAYKNLAN